MKLDVLDELRFGFGRALPVVLQTEAAECGLACLSMVAGYHGHAIDLPGLRRKFSTSLKGATLARLIEIGRRVASRKPAAAAGHGASDAA
ncbi:MAG: cysteine peptidase family C39 domain-containing protein [Acidiphilium sp.]